MSQDMTNTQKKDLANFCHVQKQCCSRSIIFVLKESVIFESERAPSTFQMSPLKVKKEFLEETNDTKLRNSAILEKFVYIGIFRDVEWYLLDY